MAESNLARLDEIIRADPDVMDVLTRFRGHALPGWRLVSGAIYQTVWNALTHRPRGYGIKDYDIAYFDSSDLSYGAEDAVIRRTVHPHLAVEVRNQARVHLWFEQHFGFAIAPLASVEDAIDNYAALTHRIGVRLETDGSLNIYAPGLDDIFALRMHPNPKNANRATYEAKAARMKALWPELTVEPWPG